MNVTIAQPMNVSSYVCMASGFGVRVNVHRHTPYRLCMYNNTIVIQYEDRDCTDTFAGHGKLVLRTATFMYTNIHGNAVLNMTM
jgi:hypothetical protein